MLKVPLEDSQLFEFSSNVNMFTCLGCKIENYTQAYWLHGQSWNMRVNFQFTHNSYLQNNDTTQYCFVIDIAVVIVFVVNFVDYFLHFVAIHFVEKPVLIALWWWLSAFSKEIMVNENNQITTRQQRRNKNFMLFSSDHSQYTAMLYWNFASFEVFKNSIRCKIYTREFSGCSSEVHTYVHCTEYTHMHIYWRHQNE